MITKKKYLARVSYPPNRQACYARLYVSRDSSIVPLSIKATFEKFDRRDLVRGTWVEVVRTDPNDARRYKITRIFIEKKPDEPEFDNVKNFKWVENMNPCGEIHIPEEDKMAMSEDRVRFFLSYRYLQFGKSMSKVLQQAFDISYGEFDELKRNFRDGFWIVCRPSQFARFLIYRDKANIQNGFKDLHVNLIGPEKDAYTRLSEKTDVPRDHVKKVILALGYDTDKFDGRPKKGVDVSKRPHQPCYSS